MPFTSLRSTSTAIVLFLLGGAALFSLPTSFAASIKTYPGFLSADEIQQFTSVDVDKEGIWYKPHKGIDAAALDPAISWRLHNVTGTPVTAEEQRQYRRSIPITKITGSTQAHLDYYVEPARAWEAVVDDEATDDSSTLGPPADLEAHPFNEIQALWQVSAKSAATGLAHLSSLLEDNRRSHVNAKMVDMIWDGEFNQISLFAIDNVQLNGNAILSVLRNACGQSDIEACGRDVAKPKMTFLHYGRIGALSLAAVTVSILVWRGTVEWRKRMQDRGVAGLGEDLMEGCGGVMT